MRLLKKCSLPLLVGGMLFSTACGGQTNVQNVSPNHVIRSTIDQEQKLLLGGEHLSYLPIPKFGLCLIGRQMRDETISLTRGILSECRRAHAAGNKPAGVFAYYARQLEENPEFFSRFVTDKESDASFLLLMTPNGSTSLIRLTTEEVKNSAVAAALAQITAGN